MRSVDGRSDMVDPPSLPAGTEDFSIEPPKPAPPTWPSNGSGPRGNWSANGRTGRLLLSQTRQPGLDSSTASSARAPLTARRPDPAPRPPEATRFQSVVGQWVPRALDSRRLVGLAKPKREACNTVISPLSTDRSRRSDSSRLAELSRPRKRFVVPRQAIAAGRFQRRPTRPGAAATMSVVSQCVAEPSLRSPADKSAASTTALSGETAEASSGAVNSSSSGNAGSGDNSLLGGAAPDSSSIAATREALSTIGNYKSQLSEAEATRKALEAELLDSQRSHAAVGCSDEAAGAPSEPGNGRSPVGTPERQQPCGLFAARHGEIAAKLGPLNMTQSPAKADSPPPWELATQPLPATRGTTQHSLCNLQAVLQECYLHESPARGGSTCEWLEEELLALQEGGSAPSSASDAAKPAKGARRKALSTCELLEDEVRALHSCSEKDSVSHQGLSPDRSGAAMRDVRERREHRLFALQHMVTPIPGRSCLAVAGSSTVRSRSVSPSVQPQFSAAEPAAVEAQATLAAEREAQELRQVVQNYERSVLPQLVVQRAVLNGELAVARAGREALEANHVALCSRVAVAEVERAALQTQLASARAAALGRRGGG